ncbi:hypothetical protein N7495_009120 [Penicillium taxi]|uniref:uncharacterized protein n=1 Tax=Penicillium taxi TaxID=168475 RepID=UPI0025451EE9|nr:uncharacterized protein N7495_009120 [Penicillium taxi]KAJ5889079.1 hypothetical protein N7495_009120 [Penicillium taxi]
MPSIADIEDHSGIDTTIESPMSQQDTAFKEAIGELSSNESLHNPERTIRGFRWFLVCIAIFSANLLYGLDTTISADIQGTVSKAFNNVTQLGWLGIGFTLGSTVAILPLGKAYGIFDTKWLYIGCLTMFAAGSALCGAAPSMNALIIGRVWAGVGGAGMYLGTLNLVTITSTSREAAFYVGLIGFVYGGGCILGPIVGGLFADSGATWRWAFYLNLVIFAVTLPIYLIVLPSFPREADRNFIQKLKELDWAGIILTAGMYLCFVLAFTFGGAIWAWNDSRVIALIVLFGVVTACFVTSQHLAFLTTKKNRLFPCDFLRNPQLVLLYICMACGGAALFVAIYYIPLYFLFVYGDSGVQAAVRLLPFVCVYVCSILTCGYVMPRVGYHIVWYLVSAIFLICGGTAMYTIRADTSPAHVYGFSVLVGLGLIVSQASYSVAASKVDADRSAEVIQFFNISQGQSQLLGLVIASSIYQSTAFDGMKSALAGLGFSDSEIQTAIAGAQSAILEQISPELRAKCIQIIVRSIGYDWLLVVVAGALQLICALFLTKKRF